MSDSGGLLVTVPAVISVGMGHRFFEGLDKKGGCEKDEVGPISGMGVPSLPMVLYGITKLG